jgi:glycine cleavage system H protein
VNIPETLTYAESHEWVRAEGDEAVVGISDYAQSELGDIVYLQFVGMESEVAARAPFGTIESVKTSSELYAPVAGKIIAVNTDLTTHPEWVNQDPYGKGWMVRIKVSDPGELAGLLTAEQYKARIGGG